MKKISILICSLFIMCSYAEIPLLPGNWNCSGKKGTLSNGELTWKNLSPSGRYKLVILRMALPEKINAAKLEAFCASLRIKSTNGKPVSVKLETSRCVED